MADELKDQRIPIMMSPSEVKAIDDWMFSNRIKSRAEAIRRLCQKSLAIDPFISDIRNRSAEHLNKLRENYKKLQQISSEHELHKFNELATDTWVDDFAVTLANMSDLSDIITLKLIYDTNNIADENEVPVSADVLAALKSGADKRTAALMEAKRLSDEARSKSEKK